MRRLLKKLILSLMMFALVITGIPFFHKGKVTAETPKVKDLVIDHNVPQVTRNINDNKIDLNALHVYDDEHFMLASDYKSIGVIPDAFCDRIGNYKII
jgi:beta-N-acetylhexosaminidase